MKSLVTLDRDGAGWIVVECPALPGCVSQGRTVEDALASIREAIAARIETRVARGLPGLSTEEFVSFLG